MEGVERLWLDQHSWVDVGRGWLDDAPVLYDALRDSVPWRQARLWRYERWVDEPRLTAGRAAAGGHAVVIEAHRDLRRGYGVDFDGPAFSWYRDGRDGVAFHRDRELRYLDDTVIAILTLGATRPFLLRRRGTEAASHDLAPAGGDLLVLGGRCQADWEHAVPKLSRLVGGRISLQWRWTSRRGRPVVGPSYRAPRTFSRSAGG